VKRLEQALGAIHVDQRILILGLGKSRADVDVLRGLHVERDALDRLQRPVQPAHSASILEQMGRVRLGLRKAPN
jgi:hypothetical protein